MGDAVGRMLASAAGIAISPMALIATVLLLATPRGRANATAFAAGWTAALTAVAAVVVAFGSWLAGGIAAPDWSWWFELAVGALLLLLGGRQWWDRPREGRVHGPPAWMRTVDRSTPARSAALGAALLATDPKNLLLAVAAAVAIGTGGAPVPGKAGAAALLVLIGSLGSLLPLAVHFRGGDRAPRRLEEWKAWAATHNTAILLTLLLTLGTTHLGTALSGLTT
ncbi:GAP family protein [Kitasatospora sp. NPDC097605]|uniref:GAP family protein n=1 Tax=Kitasatospora sp. NPDC097605 TaxID=3157226 RepID=UPI003321F83E